jgi:pilus assembly protein Flp/PilA
MRRTQVSGSRDRGATATEYAILVGFIAIALIGGITVFGSALDDWFSHLASNLDTLL